jgi:hypothetical protein
MGFEDIHEEKTPEEIAQLSRQRWEENIMGRLLKFYELERLAPVLRHRCKEASGKPFLLFSWFYQEFPDYPVWFAFRKVRYLHEIGMEDFVNRFTKTHLYQAYVDDKEQMPEHAVELDKSFGLVFEYIHGMGATVMTNAERFLQVGQRRFVAEVNGEILHIQPLEHLLASLGWSPS